jgi:putative ATP-dependent endonuclease of OLD family
MIEKVCIRIYRLFKSFDLNFSSGVNVIVGDNASGKSTLIEAIAVALTGRLQGRPLLYEFSPHLVNFEATQAFVRAVRTGGGTLPEAPEVTIDVFLSARDETEPLRGTNNVLSEDACGVRVRAALSPDYEEEFRAFLASAADVRLVPTEYYRVEWLGFSGNAITARSIPVGASIVDSGAARPVGGADHYLQQVLRENLDPRDRVELSREYRNLREKFNEQEAVKGINDRLSKLGGDVTDKKLTLSIDLSQRSTWESGLTAHLDELPFALVGKGEQTSLRTMLALGKEVATETRVILIEEPETHLSHASLRMLLKRIESRCAGKQVIVATHSSFVLNKLGLGNLVLLGRGAATRLTDLSPDTTEYFKRIPGYDTLRLVLAPKCILVEGRSDELVVQRAYRDTHGILPMDAGIDVTSVRGLSFKRFCELAKALGKPVAVVTDNDGVAVAEVRERYEGNPKSEFVDVHVGAPEDGRTLEPQVVAVNDVGLLNEVLGTSGETKDDLIAWMVGDKTGAALAIFESAKAIVMPEYVRRAVAK